jgi:hypothetical protein
MTETWLTLILLGLTASFMLGVLAIEALMLGSRRGAAKVAGLLAGITLARIIIVFGAFSIFASVLDLMRLVAVWAAESALQVVQDMHALIVAEGHWLLDFALLLAGVAIIIEAIRYAVGGAGTAVSDEASEIDESRQGVLGALGIGLLLTIIDPKQWVLAVAAMNVILRMPPRITHQFAALGAYLLLGISLVAIPLLLYFIRPRQAQALLATLNGWISGAMRYLIAAALGLIGVYFIWNGADVFAALL